ncbi:MAG: helix-turn-helix transcriptional regulator [Candidatus Accumulibacter sp.]|jgi:DNA-binding HxlR family transcriptional regulator|nr:helix-turn-helix transcriptional regulator [Accumulibacter sp.]
MEKNFCPIRDILDRFGDKWSVLTLHTLNENDVVRFGELGRRIPDMSQKMLTATLRRLEADGLIARKAYPEIPPRVEYTLTETGKSLIPHIHGLVEWALQHRKAVLSARKKSEKNSGVSA